MTDNLKNTNLEAEGVEIISNIEFGKGGKRLLLLDAFRLKGKQDKPMPVIIWIHGGGWSDPNLDKMYRPESQIIRLVKRGYFCVSIEYRLSTESVFPAQIQDCKCAVRFLRAKADEYNIDPEKIGVWGESAGGHLAALLGVTEDVKEFEGNGGWNEYSSGVQAVCEWYGPSDFVLSTRDNNDVESAVARLIGGSIKENQDKLWAASPIKYVRKGLPPFLIMHGDVDKLVPFEQSKIFYDELKKAKVEVDICVVKGQGHGFFEGDNYYNTIFNFFDKHLK